jgi:hypothetical protein
MKIFSTLGFFKDANPQDEPSAIAPLKVGRLLTEFADSTEQARCRLLLPLFRGE